jgi:hypothetical protein
MFGKLAPFSIKGSLTAEDIEIVPPAFRQYFLYNSPNYQVFTNVGLGDS